LLESKGSVGDREIDDVGFCDNTEHGIRFIHAALLGYVIESRTFGDALACGRSLFRIGKDDLTQFALFRSSVAVFALLEIRLGVAHGVGFSNIRRRQTQQRDFPKFWCPEKSLPLLEVFAQHLGRRRRDFASLSRAEHHILDAALFVSILIEGGRRDGRDLHFATDTLGNLPSQQRSALVVYKPSFRKSRLADEL